MKPSRRAPFNTMLAVSAFALAFLLARAPAAVHASSGDKAAGAAVYHSSGCEYCHGADRLGVTDRGPELSSVGKRRTKDDIAKQIAAGGGGMPSFASSLSRDQIADLVAFLSAKEKAGPRGALAGGQAAANGSQR